MIPTKHDIFIFSLQGVTGWFPQNMTFSFFPWRGLQGDSHKTWHFQSFLAGWYRVIPTKHDIFNLSLQGVTVWFPQNMTFSIFPCRLIPSDSHKTWHFQSFPCRLIQGDSLKTWHFHSFPAQVDTGWFPQNMTFSFFPCRWLQGDSYKTWYFHSFPSQVDAGWFPQNMTFSFFPFTGWYRVIPAKHDILILSLQVDTGDSYRTWHFHSFPAHVVTGWFLQNITFSFFPVGGYRVIPTEHDISPGRFLQKYSFSR